MDRRVTVGVMVFEIMIVDDRIECDRDTQHTKGMEVKCYPTVNGPRLFFSDVCFCAGFQVSKRAHKRGNERCDYEEMTNVADEIVNYFIHDQTPALSFSSTYFEGHFSSILSATKVFSW